MIIYHAKFFELSGSLHNKITKLNFHMYAFSLSKMKVVIVPKSSQKVNVKPRDVTSSSNLWKLSN